MSNNLRLNTEKDSSSATAAYWKQFRAPLFRNRWRFNDQYKRFFRPLRITSGVLVKRAFDLVTVSLGLILVAPVLLLIAALIKLEDGGPVFFKQQRVGKAGKIFRMWKFRSMVTDAEALKSELLDQNQHATGVTFKMANDPRITRIGRLLRRFSIDELPQLINILRGEMSLVGPRPASHYEVSEYNSLHLRRLKVTPGLTCIWQVSGRSEIEFERQVRMDIEYIEAASFWFDLKLLMRTVPAVVSGRGAY